MLSISVLPPFIFTYYQFHSCQQLQFFIFIHINTFTVSQIINFIFINNFTDYLFHFCQQFHRYSFFFVSINSFTDYQFCSCQQFSAPINDSPPDEFVGPELEEEWELKRMDLNSAVRESLMDGSDGFHRS